MHQLIIKTKFVLRLGVVVEVALVLHLTLGLHSRCSNFACLRGQQACRLGLLVESLVLEEPGRLLLVVNYVLN